MRRLAVFAALAAGCSLIAHTDEYSVGQSPAGGDSGTADAAGDVGASESGGDDGGNVETGPGDAGPDACPTGVNCEPSTCVPFDNASRIAGFVPDAGLPPLPEAGVAEGGTVADAGAADAGEGLAACSSLPQPVYVVGSSGLVSLAAELGALVSTVPITIVFMTGHSCDGAKTVILDETSLDIGQTTATYWDISGTAHTCALDPGGDDADIGLSGLFPAACLSLPQGTPGVGDFLGAVVPDAVVAPIASSQSAISAEALYYTVGLGTGAVAPWTDPSFIFENPVSGTQADFGLAIGVPPTQWKGTPVASATQNIAKVATSTSPEQTLGVMSCDLVENASTSSTIKELVYQDFGHGCGYYPNATATSADKVPVRNGLYPVWSYTHMLTKVNAQNVPLNPNAAQIVLYFTGAAPTPTGDFLKFVVNDHLVPPCAMRVTRSAEMGPLSPYTPSPGCGCYFDNLTTGTANCQTCTTSTDCPSTASHCNLGYCEVN